MVGPWVVLRGADLLYLVNRFVAARANGLLGKFARLHAVVLDNVPWVGGNRLLLEDAVELVVIHDVPFVNLPQQNGIQGTYENITQ